MLFVYSLVFCLLDAGKVLLFTSDVLLVRRAHVRYCCHSWPVWLYHIFPQALIKVTILRGRKLFSMQRLSETFTILRRIRRDIGINWCEMSS